VDKSHIICKGTEKFRISERLRGLLCHLGQSAVFCEGEETIKEFTGLEISGKQIQRVSEYYGGLVNALVNANCEAVIPRINNADKEDPVYVMMDGSMLCTREHKWREIKLGRIFFDSDNVDIQQNRREIMRSIYVSHLGGCEDFLLKLERHLTRYQKKVILADGASWIWKWAENNYPGAVQILDFYHAMEKLVLFAKYQIADEDKRKDWLSEQKEKLLNNEVADVIDSLLSIRPRNKESVEAKEMAIRYYQEHEDRMEYKTYRERGLLIGSGPIEAAHRSVIQQRMKLSGQQWSIPGAQAIGNLRCLKKSQAWDKLLSLVKAA
jgi:hypothetical protein